MANIFIERRKLNEGVALTWDIAHHLYIRAGEEDVLIITEKPAVILAALRKQWLRVIYKIRKEYSSAITSTRKELIGQKIHRMEVLSFTTSSKKSSAPRIYLVTPAQVSKLEDSYDVAYLTCEIKDETRNELIERLSRLAVLVDYNEP